MTRGFTPTNGRAVGVSGRGIVQIVPPASGILRYTFDDAYTNGSTALDAWNSHDGTISGATTGVAGANQTYSTNEAYSFDGTDDYVDTTYYYDTPADITLCAWINPDDTANNYDVFGCRGIDSSDASESSIELELGSDGTITWKVDDPGSGNMQSISTSTTVPTGSWTFVVIVFDNTNDSATIYFNDATQEASGSISNAGRQDAIPIHVGALNNGGTLGKHLPGDIDDPRLYNKPLTSTEVSNLYNTGSISG